MLTSARDAARGRSELTSAAHSEKPAVLMRWPMHMPYDSRETRSTAEREADIFARLASVIEAAMRAPTYAERLRGIDPRTVASREALARLPVLRKSELPALQRADPPFAGFVPAPPSAFGRLFTSPGPIFEPEGRGPDPWGAARALHAMGFATGDVVLNTFSYHLVPGGFMMDSAGRARPDRAAARGRRRLPAGRLLRHAGLPQDPPRCRSESRPRCVLHQEGAGLRRRLPEVPAGGHRRARHRRLPGLRHRRYRRHRL